MKEKTTFQLLVSKFFPSYRFFKCVCIYRQLLLQWSSLNFNVYLMQEMFVCVVVFIIFHIEVQKYFVHT